MCLGWEKYWHLGQILDGKGSNDSWWLLSFSYKYPLSSPKPTDIFCSGSLLKLDFLQNRDPHSVVGWLHPHLHFLVPRVNLQKGVIIFHPVFAIYIIFYFIYLNILFKPSKCAIVSAIPHSEGLKREIWIGQEGKCQKLDRTKPLFRPFFASLPPNQILVKKDQ